MVKTILKSVSKHAKKIISVALTASLLATSVIADFPNKFGSAITASASATQTYGITQISPTERLYNYGDYTVNYKFTPKSDGSQGVSVTIKNTGTETIERWAILYDFGGDIISPWGGVIATTPSGGTYMKNAEYNADIKPNQTATVNYTLTNITSDFPSFFYFVQGRVDYEETGFSASLNITSAYSNIINGSVKIKNISDKPIENWEVEFASNFTITTSYTTSIEVIETPTGYKLRPTSSKILYPNSTVELSFAGKVPTSGVTAVMSDTSLSGVVVWDFDDSFVDEIKNYIANAPDYTETVDGNGNTIGVYTHKDGFIETKNYDSNGNLTQESATSNGVTLKTQYGYDGENMVSITNSLGKTTVLNYDNGKMTEKVNPAGNSIKYDYNINEITIDTNGLLDSNSISLGYDLDGDNLATLSGNGQVYSFEYDENNNLTIVYIGNAILLINEYDENDLLVKETYANGQYIEYVYDDNEQISEIYYNGETSPRFEYIYTEDGELFEVYDYKGDIKTQISQSETQFSSESSYISTNQTRYNYYRQTGSLGETVRESYGNYAYVWSTFSESEDGKNKTMQGAFYKNATIKTDAFGRISQKNVQDVYSSQFNYVSPSANETSELVESINYTFANSGKTLNYTYDANGFITSVSDGTNLIASYVYDEAGQLTRVNDKVQNKTFVYQYDAGGNIRNRKEYTFTTSNLGTVINTVSYSYNNSNWKDQLTNWGGKAITYDASGNPLTIGNRSFEWEMGRQLSKITLDNSSEMCYNYDSYGIRTKKTSVKNGVSTDTFYSTIDGNITAEVRDNISINYRWDDDGNIVSMSYLDYDTLNNINIASDSYFYVTNLQGDVIALADRFGNIVVEYTYDAWGKVTSITGSLANTIGEMNPFRYRSYYFDSDTGYYYLQSRYYDPEMGRFLNADDSEMLDLAVFNTLGLNLYAYCYNNPIDSSDPTGNGLLPVSGFGSFEKSYKTAVSKWADKYAPSSDGVEYGAAIYRFRVLWITWYFVGETYKGFKTQNWYTVINGLGGSHLTSVAVNFAGRLFWPITGMSVIGFAHTHPKLNTGGTNSNKPSDPDKWMKGIGFFVGERVFPIAYYDGKKVNINYF